MKALSLLGLLTSIFSTLFPSSDQSCSPTPFFLTIIKICHCLVLCTEVLFSLTFLNISAYDFPSIFTTIASVVGGSLRFRSFRFIFSAAYLLSFFLLTGIIAVYVYFNVASSCCPLYNFSPLLVAAVYGVDHSPFCTTLLHNFKRGFECVITCISNGWTFVLFVCLYILSDQLSAAAVTLIAVPTFISGTFTDLP
jgi:hypothetical protein